MGKKVDDAFDRCAFCGKSKKDVALLYKGETACICNDCAEQIFYMNYSIINGLTNNSLLDELSMDKLTPAFDYEQDLQNNSIQIKEKPIQIKTPREIKEYLDQYVIGQDVTKEKLAVAAYNHYKRINQKSSDNLDIEKSNLLIVGKSGVGKTLLVKTLAKYLDVPVAIADCTTLTEAGYVGDDVESVITQLLQNCDYDVKKAEKGIVLLDEVDKLSRKSDSPSITRDVSGEGVQQGLLKIIEGSVVHVSPKMGRKHPNADTITVDTKNILFICLGAFEGIDRIVNSRRNKSSVGFNTENNVNKDDNENVLKYLITDDFRKYGLISELLGRLPIITYMNDLNEDDLVRILLEPKNSIIKQFKALFKLDGVKLNIDKSVYNYIAKCAIKSKIGARGLRTIIEALLSDAMFEIPGSNKKVLHITLKYAQEKLKEFDRVKECA